MTDAECAVTMPPVYGKVYRVVGGYRWISRWMAHASPVCKTPEAARKWADGYEFITEESPCQRELLNI